MILGKREYNREKVPIETKGNMKQSNHLTVKYTSSEYYIVLNFM